MILQLTQSVSYYLQVALYLYRVVMLHTAPHHPTQSLLYMGWVPYESTVQN